MTGKNANDEFSKALRRRRSVPVPPVDRLPAPLRDMVHTLYPPLLCAMAEDQDTLELYGVGKLTRNILVSFMREPLSLIRLPQVLEVLQMTRPYYHLVHHQIADQCPQTTRNTVKSPLFPAENISKRDLSILLDEAVESIYAYLNDGRIDHKATVTPLPKP